MIDSVSAAPIHPIQSAAAAAKSVNQTLDGSFRQFYNQALQQSNQMPLPFNIPNGVNPINMQTNGLVAAIAQNFNCCIANIAMSNYRALTPESVQVQVLPGSFVAAALLASDGCC